MVSPFVCVLCVSPNVAENHHRIVRQNTRMMDASSSVSPCLPRGSRQRQHPRGRRRQKRRRFGPTRSGILPNENENKLRAAAERRRGEDEKKDVGRNRDDRGGGKEDVVKTLVSKMSGFYEVGGVDVYRAIDACQKTRLGVERKKTSLAEIGVYQGRSFLALLSLRKQDEKCIAIDCFENQTNNVDESGVGDYNKFRKNMAQACEAMKATGSFSWDGGVDSGLPSFIVPISKDSTKMSKETDFNEDEDGPVRIFSIDGSHTLETTLKDLKLAADECLDKKGVVILDDCFNPDWPGCVSGLAKYLSTSGQVAPFAIAYNKVYLCAPSLVEMYQESIIRDSNVAVRKRAHLFGHECIVCKHGWLHTFHGNDDAYSRVAST